MQINSEIWGQPLTEYWGYNVRNGTEDLTNPDFDTYEPFIRNNMNPDYVSPLGEAFTYSLRAGYYKENSPFEFNVDYPDYSVAYIGVQNPDMPQCNIECYGPADDSPAGDTKGVPCFKTDPNDIAAIAFVSDRPMRSYRNVTQYSIPSNEFPNITFKSTSNVYTNGIWCLSPHYRDVTNAWVNRNHSLDCAYWRSLGLRTFFGVIYVNYCDALVDSHNIPKKYDYNPVTLHWYETQTAEWREAHPIYQAYLKMCIRRNTNGLYDFTYNAADGIMPDLTYNLKVNPNYVTFEDPDTKLLSPSTMFGDGNNYIHWPLFGRNKRDTLIGQWGSVSSAGGMSSGTYPMYVGVHKGQQHKGIGTTSYERQMYITYDSDDYEWFRKGAAAYGVFFTDGDSGDEGYADLFAAGNDTYRWVNDKMCLGIVDENGHTHGEYTRGMANPTAPNWGWSNTTQSPYDPSIPPDPNNYSYITELPDWNETDQNYFASKIEGFSDEKIQIQNLIDSITQIADVSYQTIPEGLEAIANGSYMKKFVYQEPMKCILDYRKIFLKPVQMHAVGTKTIPVGSFICNLPNLPFTGYEIPKYRRIDVGSLEIKRVFNNFLDFEPYSQAYLYIPFCGMKQLPMNIFSGHTINIKMNINNYTGELQVLIFVDRIEWGTMDGMASEELPLIGETSMTASAQKRSLQHQIDMTQFNKMTGVMGSLAGASISAAMGNPLGVITQAAGAGLKSLGLNSEIKQLNFELKHTVPEALAIQKGASEIAAQNVLTPFILLQTPKIMANEDESEEEMLAMYNKTIGRACLKSGTLGQFSGFTQCSAANLDGISCTYTEKKMILEALMEGVIL